MKKSILTVTLISAALATQAYASDASYTDFARVVDAEPVYERVAHNVPQQQCWTETVRYDHRGPHSATGTIVGTLVGAAIGHQIGHDKRGKKIGRVAGAVLGGSIGHDVSHKNRHARSTYRDEQRCETRYHTNYTQELVGYDVTYRYHGKTYHTHMAHNPGNKIKVAVQVHPVY